MMFLNNSPSFLDGNGPMQVGALSVNFRFSIEANEISRLDLFPYFHCSFTIICFLIIFNIKLLNWAVLRIFDRI